MRTVKLRVTDSQGHINETTRTLSVTNAPLASFTFSPTAVKSGQMVSFNGSASSDPDGMIATYEWDLDGNASYETRTGSRPTVSRSYASPGTLSVKLRVTDNLGVSSETSRPLLVKARARRPSCGGLKGAKRVTCMRRTCRKLKGNKRGACIRRSCRYVKRDKRNACKRRSCRTLKGAKKRACVRKYSRKR